MGVIDMVNGRLCETLPIEEIEQISKERYNQALDDLVKKCEKAVFYYYRQKYVDIRDIRELAKELKGE